MMMAFFVLIAVIFCAVAVAILGVRPAFQAGFGPG